MISPAHSPRSQEQQQQQQDPQIENPTMIGDLDQDQPPPDQQFQPLPPKTLTLEIPDIETSTIAYQLDPDKPQDRQAHQDPQAEDKGRTADPPEGMPLSPSQTLMKNPQMSAYSLNPGNRPIMTPRGRGHKRKGITPKKLQAIEEKLKILSENLRPICFLPAKCLDFSKHENLLKRLKLWDFVHLEFGRDVRTDLLVQLIGNYTPNMRCSYVNNSRINLTRAELARALQLPVKKEKVGALEAGGEGDMEVFPEESVSFIEDLLSIWVLLHEDMWMMPNEVVSSTKLVKEGHPERVDWAGLIWFMVEKELMQGAQLVHCYYASHLLCLIKAQKKSVFEEDPMGSVQSEGNSGKVEVDIKDEEEEGGGSKVESDIKEEEEVVGGVEEVVDMMEGEGDVGDVRMSNLDNFQSHEAEEQNLQLTLGQDNVDKEEGMDNRILEFEESKEEELGQWFLNGKNNDNEQYLRRCDFDNVKGLDSDIGREEEEEVEGDEVGGEGEEGGQVGTFTLVPKCNALDGLSSENLIPVMEEELPYSSEGKFHDHSSGELLASRVDALTVSSRPSIFTNASKRVIDHDNDISLHSLRGNNKRLKIDGPWDNKPTDFDSCLEHAQHWMGRARMMYEAKEQTCADFNLNQQLLLNELQQRDGVIEHLHKTKCEEIEKKQMEIHKHDRELSEMYNLLQGYRKALKKTNRAFDEYKQRCEQLDEPLYMDVTGSGGLVLSTMEIEKQCLKQEEEEMMKRSVIEKMIREFEVGWTEKVEAHLVAVDTMGSKVADFVEDFTVLKDMFTESKVSDPSACASEET